jgi:hypothetical protein
MRTISTEVSISRLLRLLRPLRVKCQQLRSSSARTAYANLLNESDVLPLAELPRVRTRYQSKGFIELSLKVHAVCDAFRNLLSAICRDDWHALKPQTCVPPLATMCANVLGLEMENEVQARLAEAKELGDLEGEDESEVLEQRYEAVPWHHRR